MWFLSSLVFGATLIAMLSRVREQPHNNTLQRAFDPLAAFAVVKLPIASIAAERGLYAVKEKRR